MVGRVWRADTAWVAVLDEGSGARYVRGHDGAGDSLSSPAVARLADPGVTVRAGRGGGRAMVGRAGAGSLARGAAAARGGARRRSTGGGLDHGDRHGSSVVSAVAGSTAMSRRTESSALASESEALAAWAEWYALCAIARCGDRARAHLHRFAASRAASCLGRAGRDVRALGSPTPADLWHRFETHLVTDRTRARQPYKEWLFARATSLSGTARLDAIQGGATLILRDVLREWVRREGPSPSAVSLDDPVPGHEDLHYRDLVVGEDPREELAVRDEDEAARRLAAEAFGTAPRHTRVALCLRALGRPLFGPFAERLAGCGHTKLAGSVRRFIADLAETALRRHPREEAFAIAARAPAWVRRFALEWGRAEISMAPAFLNAEPGHLNRRGSRRLAR